MAHSKAALCAQQPLYISFQRAWKGLHDKIFLFTPHDLMWSKQKRGSITSRLPVHKLKTRWLSLEKFGNRAFDQRINSNFRHNIGCGQFAEHLIPWTPFLLGKKCEMVFNVFHLVKGFEGNGPAVWYGDNSSNSLSIEFLKIWMAIALTDRGKFFWT